MFASMGCSCVVVTCIVVMPLFRICDWNVVEAYEDRLSAGPNLLGSLPCVWHCVWFCTTGGGSRGGGVFGPLGTTVPWGVSPKGQGGPWAPPPCCDNSPETLFAWCVCVCLFLLGAYWIYVWFVCVVFIGLWGRHVIWFGALQDLPLVRIGVCSPFFFCSRALSVVGMFVGDVFSLSLSLRCWGNPNPFWGLGFPLCFFTLDTDSVFNPYTKLDFYP